MTARGRTSALALVETFATDQRSCGRVWLMVPREELVAVAVAVAPDPEDEDQDEDELEDDQVVKAELELAGHRRSRGESELRSSAKRKVG